MPGLESINWLWVVVAAIVYFGLGALWYGPLLGKTWAQGMGFGWPASDELKVAAPDYVITFIAELGICIALAALLSAGSVSGIGGALQVALWLWLGLVATTHAVNAVFDSRPWTVYAINIGYHLVGMLVAAVILTSFG